MIDSILHPELWEKAKAKVSRNRHGSLTAYLLAVKEEYEKSGGKFGKKNKKGKLILNE